MSDESRQFDLFDAETLRGPGGEAALRSMRDRALVCNKCPLHVGRTNVVFGIGNSNRPDIAFVGEGPGENEDLKGEPFVGRAGQLLDKMIEAMDLERTKVYICNVVCCRPPNNRRPEAEEIEACKEYLVGQLRVVSPRFIVCLGGTAAQVLLKSTKAIGDLRGRWHEWEGVPLRATYHPAYLLRDPRKKKDVWGDLQLVMQRLRVLHDSENGRGQGDGHEPGQGTEEDRRADDQGHHENSGVEDRREGGGSGGGSPPVT